MIKKYAQYSDEELVRLLSLDDGNAFKAIYERHWEKLYDNAYYRLRNTEIAKDILQDIFIWLWEKRTVLHIVSLGSYLHAAVRFKVANSIRSGNIRENFYKEIANLNLSIADPTPKEIAEVNELNKIIQEAIQQLPPKCKEVYLLRREEQLSNQKIADRLHLSLKTVENQITIAQKKMREYLGPYTIAVLLTYVFHGTKFF